MSARCSIDRNPEPPPSFATLSNFDLGFDSFQPRRVGRLRCTSCLRKHVLVSDARSFHLSNLERVVLVRLVTLRHPFVSFLSRVASCREREMRGRLSRVLHHRRPPLFFCFIFFGMGDSHPPFPRCKKKRERQRGRLGNVRKGTLEG